MLTTNGTALTTLLQSKTLLDALDTMASYGQVTDSMNTLVLDVRANADQLAEVQSQQQHQEQQIEPEAIRNRNGALLNPGPRYRRPPTASERLRRLSSLIGYAVRTLTDRRTLSRLVTVSSGTTDRRLSLDAGWLPAPPPVPISSP
jgi:hypothetical protein